MRCCDSGSRGRLCGSSRNLSFRADPAARWRARRHDGRPALAPTPAPASLYIVNGGAMIFAQPLRVHHTAICSESIRQEVIGSGLSWKPSGSQGGGLGWQSCNTVTVRLSLILEVSLTLFQYHSMLRRASAFPKLHRVPNVVSERPVCYHWDLHFPSCLTYAQDAGSGSAR
jgi:hypothetical protein